MLRFEKHTFLPWKLILSGPTEFLTKSAPKKNKIKIRTSREGFLNYIATNSDGYGKKDIQ